MKPVKFKRFEIRRPKWDPHPEKSTTNNSVWRQGLFLVFEDYEGNEFDYMPLWDDLELLNLKRQEVELINKKIAREVAKQ